MKEQKSSKENDSTLEQQEKEQLEQLIKQMEEKMVIGGQALEDKEKEAAKKHRDLQLKLKTEKKRQRLLLEER